MRPNFFPSLSFSLFPELLERLLSREYPPESFYRILRERYQFQVISSVDYQNLAVEFQLTPILNWNGHSSLLVKFQQTQVCPPTIQIPFEYELTILRRMSGRGLTLFTDPPCCERTCTNEFRRPIQRSWEVFDRGQFCEMLYTFPTSPAGGRRLVDVNSSASQVPCSHPSVES